eukprot:Protomagalhaensia_sp_Gyna_25__5452@NODE_715_length_2788_cov_52_276464_g557_i0_p2_GENE_NODE_715_length_2788_cov_52_276464_g557_i0NODE_715_length_2788_cov_52_276464_g557_i0_p2_ORF_typecomplete_len180_score33_58PP2C/PF00481_21/7e23SpoIIE/PF07228_12/0_089_NODE_715_length_2788_cov_52_276464_g557_i017212260
MAVEDVAVEDLLDDKLIGTVFTEAIQRLDTRTALEIPSGRDGCCLCLLVVPKLLIKKPNGTLWNRCSEVVYCVNLGDAGAFLCRKGLQLAGPQQLQREGSFDTENQLHAIPLCDQHKPFVIAEKQRILMAGGTIENAKVNGVLRVTRSLGDLPLKKFGVSSTPTFKKVRLQLLEVVVAK